MRRLWPAYRRVKATARQGAGLFGDAPYRDAPEDVADKHLKVLENAPALETAQHEGGSPYRRTFRNGATLFPRMLVFVERKQMGRLGADPSAPFVESRRNNQEKKPWKDLPSIANRVEAEFLHPVLLGESILPYRIFKSFEGVVPVTSKGELLDAAAAANRGYDGLHGWMAKAEAVWDETQASDISYINNFRLFWAIVGAISASRRFASPMRRRARFHVHACSTNKVTIEHVLYWCPVENKMRGSFLSLSSIAKRRAQSGCVSSTRPVGSPPLRQGDL